MNIKDITIKNFSPCISVEQLEAMFDKRELKSFWEWMRGQTCPLGGVYQGDLEDYLRYRHKGIKAKDIPLLD